jgi:hypothetical protein
MKKFILIISLGLVLLSITSQAQWRLNAGIDLLKTEFFQENNFPAIQLGLEAAYYVTSSVALTGGLEIWDKPDLFGGSLGVRFYPVNPIFLRFRGILAEDSDFSLGLGYALPLNKKWRLETMTDYYAVNKDFALRLGIGYRL